LGHIIPQTPSVGGYCPTLDILQFDIREAEIASLGRRDGSLGRIYGGRRVGECRCVSPEAGSIVRALPDAGNIKLADISVVFW